MTGLLYSDNLVLYDKLEEDHRAMVGCFAKVCKRGLEVNRDKSKVMVFSGEEGLECEVCMCQILNICDVFWMDKGAVGRGWVRGGLKVLLALFLILGVYQY